MRNIDVGLRVREYVEANCRLDSLFSERTARPCKKTATCRTYVVGIFWSSTSACTKIDTQQSPRSMFML